jgi:DNA recombination protein RmuC
MMDNTNQIHQQNAEHIRAFNETLSRELQDMRVGMQQKLDEIRDTVDEQLQTNLEKKLQESFRTVSEQLIAVQRGLGEMQSLASNVGDLKKTLSNVKTRGIWGEIQLGSILSDILSPSQYDTNVVTVPNTVNRVEYAIKLPGSGNDTVYLPIDSKFPGDTYNKLLDAYESGSSDAVAFAWKELEKVLCSEAKDIHDKYIRTPDTTEFGIMFLPVEGLYAEAVKHGMVEKLQNLYKINIAGPTTMAALLNSLQMGFKTLQIQKQSGEVWKILQSTRVEFDKYAEVLQKAQSNLKKTQEDLETLVGVRTRVLSSKLSKIEQYQPELPEGE